MTERLCANDLRLRYGRRVALDGVSLSLRAGEIAVLTGPNGSGKTSLLEVLLGSRRPERGEVQLDRQPLHTLRTRQRARLLTLVPQSVDLRFDFSVENVVEMGRSPWLPPFASPGPDDRRAVDQALAQTQTSALRHRSLHELSAGERQRVHLARALAQQPQVLLLDEPTACLDRAHARSLLTTLRDFADRGGSVLMTSHDLALTGRHADRVLVMDQGRLSSDRPSAAKPAPRVIFVLGGARSGKSRQAATLAQRLAPDPVYLATSRVSADDPEHQRRVDRHRADRGPEWTTIEEERLISRHPLDGRVVVVDCLTLWLTNWFMHERASPELAFERTLDSARAELDRTLARNATWILVSNEIGQGVHAMTEIGRQFTDLQGFVNQHAASRADTVVLMVAGIPHVIKGQLPP